MNWTFEPGHSAAEFRARHMMVTWVRGSFKNMHGSLDFDPASPRAPAVEATIDVASCWTGEPTRDRKWLRCPFGRRPRLRSDLAG
jgi:polyisoprenoid-binding protein YceI